MSTDREWQAWGERDPYFGVLTHPQFRRANLTLQSLEEFFQTGRDELRDLIDDCRRHVGSVSTRCTLEFGCGVGRLLIPASESAEVCVGVDVSDAMRAEAARNCERFDRRNIQLVEALEEAAAINGRYTFIYSYIVLQHLDPSRGLDVIAALLELLDSGGTAALHVTYGRSKYPATYGQQPLGRRLVRNIRRPLSRLRHRMGKRDPQMQMNAYDLNRVLFVIQAAGVRHCGLRLTDHGGYLGAVFCLKRD